jgi:hypothetical protein
MRWAQWRSVGIVVAGGRRRVLAGHRSLDAQAPGAAAAAGRAWPTWRDRSAPASAGRRRQWGEGEARGVPVRGRQEQPIVWRDTVYLTTAVPGDAGALKFSLIALPAPTARTWSQVLHQEKPHEGHHPTAHRRRSRSPTAAALCLVQPRGLYAVDFSARCCGRSRTRQNAHGLRRGQLGRRPRRHADRARDHEGAGCHRPRRGRQEEVAHAARGADDGRRGSSPPAGRRTCSPAPAVVGYDPPPARRCGRPGAPRRAIPTRVRRRPG